MTIKEKTHNDCGNNQYASQADVLYIHKINIKSIARSGTKSKYFSKEIPTRVGERSALCVKLF